MTARVAICVPECPRAWRYAFPNARARGDMHSRMPARMCRITTPAGSRGTWRRCCGMRAGAAPWSAPARTPRCRSSRPPGRACRCGRAHGDMHSRMRSRASVEYASHGDMLSARLCVPMCVSESAARTCSACFPWCRTAACPRTSPRGAHSRPTSPPLCGLWGSRSRTWPRARCAYGFLYGPPPFDIWLPVWAAPIYGFPVWAAPHSTYGFLYGPPPFDIWLSRMGRPHSTYGFLYGPPPFDICAARVRHVTGRAGTTMRHRRWSRCCLSSATRSQRSRRGRRALNPRPTSRGRSRTSLTWFRA